MIEWIFLLWNEMKQMINSWNQINAAAHSSLSLPPNHSLRMDGLVEKREEKKSLAAPRQWMSEEMKWMNGFICRGSTMGELVELSEVEFVGGLRALLRHGNQPTKETSQLNQLVFYFHSAPWNQLNCEIDFIGLLNWNEIGLWVSWWNEMASRGSEMEWIYEWNFSLRASMKWNQWTGGPSAEGQRNQNQPFFAAGRGKPAKNWCGCCGLIPFFSINQMEWRLIGCAARSFSCADMPR